MKFVDDFAPFTREHWDFLKNWKGQAMSTQIRLTDVIIHVDEKHDVDPGMAELYEVVKTAYKTDQKQRAENPDAKQFYDAAPICIGGEFGPAPEKEKV